MTGPPLSVAMLRRSVREALADVPIGATVLVACSGGADSLALLAATAFCAREPSWRVGMITIDHGLQPGSEKRAAELVEWARGVGVDPAESIAVDVTGTGGAEAAARDTRYAALEKAATRHGAFVVLLGHTLDDQAETVLLGLSRGAGARSLAGMPAQRGIFRRPLLGLPRNVIRRVAESDPFLRDISIWDDPHNSSPAYRRSKLRTLMPALADVLGPGMGRNLARTARLLRADADALDAIATEARRELGADDGSLDAVRLAELPDAIRTRVIHALLLDAGVAGADLRAVHVDGVDALVISWHGQGPVALPQRLAAHRQNGRLHVAPDDSWGE